MGREIRTALTKALVTQGHAAEANLPAITPDQMPRLFAGIYGLGSRDFRPEHILGAYEFATGTRTRKDGKGIADGVSFFVLGVDHPYEVKSDDTPSLLPEKAVAVRFHSIGGWGAITTGKNLGAIIGDLNDLLYDRDKVVDELGNPKEIIHVSANPKYGSEKKGAPTSYFMVAAPERIRVNCDLRHVTVVLCCDPKAFTHTNPLDGILEGGASDLGIGGRRGEGLGAACPCGRAGKSSTKIFASTRCPGLKLPAMRPIARTLQLQNAGQRFSWGVLFGVADFAGVPDYAGTIPGSGSQAIRQEIRTAGRRGREFQHGSHDAGL